MHLMFGFCGTERPNNTPQVGEHLTLTNLIQRDTGNDATITIETDRVDDHTASISIHGYCTFNSRRYSAQVVINRELPQYDSVALSYCA